MARGGFPGMGGANIQQLMRQAQKMQEQMQQMQQDLDARTYEAAAGGGMVKVKVSGAREVLELMIDPQAVDPDDVEMLQDLVLAAVNEALRKGEETREAEIAKMNAAAGLGGMF